MTEPLRDFAEQLSEALRAPLQRIRQTMETGRTSSRHPNLTNGPNRRAADYDEFLAAATATIQAAADDPDAPRIVIDSLPDDIDAHTEAAIRAFPLEIPDWVNLITDAPYRFAEADPDCQRCVGLGVILSPSSDTPAEYAGLDDCVPCPVCMQPRIDRGALIQEHGSWNDYLRFLDVGTGPSRLWIPD